MDCPRKSLGTAKKKKYIEAMSLAKVLSTKVRQMCQHKLSVKSKAFTMEPWLNDPLNTSLARSSESVFRVSRATKLKIDGVRSDRTTAVNHTTPFEYGKNHSFYSTFLIPNDGRSFTPHSSWILATNTVNDHV